MSAPASSKPGSSQKIRLRQTKVVATLGPASGTIEVIRDLVAAGADVFRLNFSHGAHEEHRARFDILRQVEAETGRPIAVMADLQGPKLRISTFSGGPIELTEGQTFRLDLSTEPGDTTRVGLPHPEIFAALKPKTDLLLDDGRVRLHVVSCASDHAVTTVVSGRTLSNRKGVNVPDVVLPLSALTEKDRKDLAFALELGVDWVALSFVQRPADLIEARELIGDRAALLAKIEKPQAIDTLSEIIKLADGIMVARGDLGVEMRPGDRAHPAKARRSSGPPLRKALRGGYPDARLHGAQPAPHACGSVGRGQRRVRRRPGGDALRRNRWRSIPVAGRADHGPHPSRRRGRHRLAPHPPRDFQPDPGNRGWIGALVGAHQGSVYRHFLSYHGDRPPDRRIPLGNPRDRGLL